MGILFIPILLVIMYFLILRPQQKRVKDQRAMLNVIDVGDDVRTDSGIYGTISDLDGDTVFLMVADGVEIKISKASIAEMIKYDED
tara:strand:+ start:573 stop:830 length:258 start_codon:yes stop_codon:yes gene_type:complete